MKLVSEKAEFIGDITHKDEATTLRFVEKCARQCYRSEQHDDYTKTVRYLKALAHKGHTSLFEHSQIVLHRSSIPDDELTRWWEQMCATGYYRFFDLESPSHIAGNVRSWMQTFDTQFPTIYGSVKFALPMFFDEWDVPSISGACVPQEEVPNCIRRYAAHVYMDNGVLREWTRHRMSYSVESTRYCNYTKDKFGGGSIDFHGQANIGYGVSSAPLDTEENIVHHQADTLMHNTFEYVEGIYNRLIEIGIKPQIARQVLPMSLMCRAYVSGVPFYWNNFFKLRDAPDAHPNIQFLARDLRRQYEDYTSRLQQ